MTEPRIWDGINGADIGLDLQNFWIEQTIYARWPRQQSQDVNNTSSELEYIPI